MADNNPNARAKYGWPSQDPNLISDIRKTAERLEDHILGMNFMQAPNHLQSLSHASDAEILSLYPACGNFSRDELEAFCAGFRRCAAVLSGTDRALDAETSAKWTAENLKVLGDEHK